MRVADWLIRRLADEGLKHIFLLPGGGAMYLNDAIALEPRLRGITCQHEQACGIAAEAYGRTGGAKNPGFGVAVVTSGPGATNVITPVVGAWIDSVPMLIISGQAKRSDLMMARGIRQGGVQEVDIIKLVASVTKYAERVLDPSRATFQLEQALSEMRKGRPGPVWLDVPLDVQAAPFPIPSASQTNVLEVSSDVPERYDTLRDDSHDLRRTVDSIMDLLVNAERPLVLAGHGVRLAGASEVYRLMIDTLKIPSVSTWNALDLLPHDFELNIGRPGSVATRAANFAVQNCDVLICIGARLDNVTTAYDLRNFAKFAKKVIVDIDKAELDDKAHLTDTVLINADAKRFIEAMISSARPLHIGAWRDRCLSWKNRYGNEDSVVTTRFGQISHSALIEVLSDSIPENRLVVTGSSGLAIEFFYTRFRNKGGQRVFLTSGLGSMGYGLPAAIGACLGNESQTTIAIESDGSLQLNVQELATLATLSLPICLVIMNNLGYASIRNSQRNYFDSRYIGSSADSGLPLVDLEKLSAVYDIPYLRVDDLQNLSEALRQGVVTRTPLLIDVNVISNETLQPKCSATPQTDGSLLSMPLEDMTPLLPLDVLEREMNGRISKVSLKARGI